MTDKQAMRSVLADVALWGTLCLCLAVTGCAAGEWLTGAENVEEGMAADSPLATGIDAVDDFLPPPWGTILSLVGLQAGNLLANRSRKKKVVTA
jgi:hypothetical protein